MFTMDTLVASLFAENQSANNRRGESVPIIRFAFSCLVFLVRSCVTNYAQRQFYLEKSAFSIHLTVYNIQFDFST